MRVEIVDIGKGDAHRCRKEFLIGQKGTLATERHDGNDFYWGVFYPDNIEVLESYNFLQIKTKPIFDDCPT